jgi:hypothetical protein
MDDIKGDIRSEIKNIGKSEMNQTITARLNTPESYGTANITIDSTYKILNEITKPDFKNSIDVNSLTNDQTTSIMTNFEKNNPKLIQAINDIITSIMGPYMTNGVIRHRLIY